MDNLVERLTSKEPTGYFATGGGSVVCGDLERAHAYGGQPLYKLRNPDGPEAAARIEELEAALTKVREAYQRWCDGADEADAIIAVGAALTSTSKALSTGGEEA